MTTASKAAAQLGRRGGLANTDAQNEARRQNAQFAGRPRRICRFCGEPVLGGHVDRRLDESCGAHGWRWQKRSAEDRRPVRPDPKLLADLLTFLEPDPADVFDDNSRVLPPRLLARLRRAAAALD